MRWKLMGIAGLIGAVAVAAVAVDRHRARTWTEYGSDELRAKLHERLEAAG
jgi:hypothetical protein